MAGHSQFKNIMHRKGRQDAAKSKLFGKLAREITVSAKLGLPDPAMNPRLRAAILLFVLIPYWVDIIVRSFSWLIMLGDNGLINKALIGLGLVDGPLALLYNSFSVLVAMTQILLPITIVTLFGAMLRIDRTLMAAATIHGAGDWRVFRHVFFPLSLPGVYGAGLLAFVGVAVIQKLVGLQRAF